MTAETNGFGFGPVATRTRTASGALLGVLLHQRGGALVGALALLRQLRLQLRRLLQLQLQQ